MLTGWSSMSYTTTHNPLLASSGISFNKSWAMRTANILATRSSSSMVTESDSNVARSVMLQLYLMREPTVANVSGSSRVAPYTLCVAYSDNLLRCCSQTVTIPKL
jgi:predicted component of type VI protein secretion system